VNILLGLLLGIIAGTLINLFVVRPLSWRVAQWIDKKRGGEMPGWCYSTKFLWWR